MPIDPQLCDRDATTAYADGSVALGELFAFLRAAVRREASDVHLVPDYPPTFRVHGELEAAGERPLAAQQIEDMLRAIDAARLNADGGRGFDCSIALPGDATACRFRLNAYRAMDQWCACLRHIPDQIPTFEWLGFPVDLANRIVGLNNGLVVLTGVTGSGKSASLAALIALARQAGRQHILTVEEPIEYIHPPGAGGIVTQREVGRDVDSFADGLKYGLRQDPDVILVGEIRDRDTAQMALSAAETGHLILTTLHTRDAKGALTRLVDLFPYEAQDDVRKQLAMSLRCVVSQHLLPAATAGEKRVLALEVLQVNQQVQVAIRSGKIEMIESAIQTGRRDGMLMLDDDLQRLVRGGAIAGDTARGVAKDPAAINGGVQKW